MFAFTDSIAASWKKRKMFPNEKYFCDSAHDPHDPQPAGDDLPAVIVTHNSGRCHCSTVLLNWERARELLLPQRYHSCANPFHILGFYAHRLGQGFESGQLKKKTENNLSTLEVWACSRQARWSPSGQQCGSLRAAATLSPYRVRVVIRNVCNWATTHQLLLSIAVIAASGCPAMGQTWGWRLQLINLNLTTITHWGLICHLSLNSQQ